MLTIVGFVIVIVGVLTGYVAHHGDVAVLWQPTEVIIIGGAAGGALLAAAPMAQIKEMFHQIGGVVKGKEPTKADMLELLMLMYELTKTAKGNLLGLEAHVENPEGSDIFKRYPNMLANHHLIHFISDTLKVQISSPVSPYDLEDLMDGDIKAVHEFEDTAPENVNRVAEAMPGLGIVAAVLGVVITMGKLTEGKEVIGMSIAAALVGTFLGVIGCYGFLQPLQAKMKAVIQEQALFFKVAKLALLAFSKDCSPKVCVEFSRRAIPHHIRPTFNELDEATQNAGKAAA